VEFRSRLVDEQRVLSRVACLTADPCLDGIETLGSLMDIIEIGDIAEGAEQLNQARGPIPNDAPWRQIPTEPLIRAIARQGDVSVHVNPRSPDRLLFEQFLPYDITDGFANH
jgi:hypothetical protein